MAMNSVDFVSRFVPLAREGKSALEIGKMLGFTGTDKKISQAVSVKASQVRKRLQVEAESKAKAEGLDKEQTEALVKVYGAKLPRIKSHGRKSEVSEIVSALDAVLAALDAPVAELDEELITEDKPKRNKRD